MQIFSVAAAASLVLTVAGSALPKLAPYSTQKPNEQIFDSPIVIVGVIVSDLPAKERDPCLPNGDCPMWLRKLTVRVENSLRGNLQPGIVAVYYFAFAGAYSSPDAMGSWRGMYRRIFWLRKDSGVLRAASDGHNYCAFPVLSGAHPNYRADPRKPLGYAMADIWFTKGTGTTDIEFASGIDSGAPSTIPEAYLFEKLQRLAATGAPVVRTAACKQLSYYDQKCAEL